MAEIFYGSDDDFLPTGDVLYLDHLVVGESGEVHLESVADGIIHLVCPTSANVMQTLPAADGVAGPGLNGYVVNDVTIQSYAEISLIFLDG